MIENNQYAYSSPNSIEFACEKLSDRAVGYGIKGTTIDGTDIELVYETCKQGIDSCRASSMPMLIETETMRMRGHAEHDDFGYVPQEVLDYWEPRDPLKRYQEFLIKETIMLEDDINQLRTILKTDINNAIDSAVQKPFPNSIEGRKSVFVNS
jgi:TPP-dependent pyruvate/acetoin dehydrogenase alpha subunit